MTDEPTPQMLGPAERAGIRWRISSRSGHSADCVEVGFLTDGSERVAVRHSHHPDGVLIVYTAGEWAAFVAGVRDGEFDRA